MASSVRRTILEELFPAPIGSVIDDDDDQDENEDEEIGNAIEEDDEEQNRKGNKPQPPYEPAKDVKNLDGDAESSRMGEGKSCSPENDMKFCSICLERLDTRTLVQTPCDHMFHRDCLLTWIANSDHNDSCPTCRYQPLYDVEKYNLLLADHPDFCSTNRPQATTTTTPTTRSGSNFIPSTHLVYLVGCVLILQIGIMSVFIYGLGTSSPTLLEDRPYQFTNLTMSCANVTMPFEEMGTRDEIFCNKSVMQGSCTICNILEPDECLCYCRDELLVLGIQYTESSKCCKCFRV